MIVYGDPAQECTSHAVGARLSELLGRARMAGRGGMDALRDLLVLAGQYEQGVADAAEKQSTDVAPARIADAQRLTDLIAQGFVARLEKPDCSTAESGCTQIEAALAGMRAAPNVELRLKVPEGFAFYMLYPEQYCMATRRWSADHACSRSREVLVVGVRSIGTTLSAVVAATLAAEGWAPQRLSVRPHGHPFNRCVHLEVQTVRRAEYALIVDEGPGLSGSSMAATADALVRAGLQAERVAFLPGHADAPGEAGSDHVRRWWSTAPRYVADVSELRWQGVSLQAALAERTASYFKEMVAQVQDCGGGLWRTAVYADPMHWPAVCARFERPKYRIVTASGAALLWKYGGCLCDRLREKQESLASGGWTVPPVDAELGFIATEWVRGHALTRRDLTPSLLDRMLRYIVDAAGPALEDDEQQSAFTRIGEMLCCNVREALGEQTGRRADAWTAAAREMQVTGPSAGDGRLAPHEWLRTPDGRIVKVDCGGHEVDHTVAGRQPVLWDVAGAMVEWGVLPADLPEWIGAAETAGVPRVQAKLLTFYRMVYAAFRMGQCVFCADGSEPDEATRLQAAAESYKAQLAGLLRESPPG